MWGGFNALFQPELDRLKVKYRCEFITYSYYSSIYTWNFYLTRSRYRATELIAGFDGGQGEIA